MELLATDNRVRSLLIVGTPPVPLQPESLADAFHQSETMELTGKRDFTDADAVAYGSAMMGGSEFLSQELLDSLKRTDGRRRCSSGAIPISCDPCPCRLSESGSGSRN